MILACDQPAGSQRVGNRKSAKKADKHTSAGSVQQEHGNSSTESGSTSSVGRSDIIRLCTVLAGQVHAGTKTRQKNFMISLDGLIWGNPALFLANVMMKKKSIV